MSKRTHLRVGTCGFAERQERLFRDFDILEVQQTYCQPPRAETAARWRERAPRGFIFALKAWQLITHESASPTYRRLKEKLSPVQLARCGDFKWNAVTRMAWERTQDIAAALKARAIVLQAPASFKPTPANVRRLAAFFERIERRGRRPVFEPRGAVWGDTLLRRLATELELTIAVDPFLRAPVGRGLRYFRLHGRPAYHYHYRYTRADLESLAEIAGKGPAWVLFNNDTMADDARRFRRLLNIA